MNYNSEKKYNYKNMIKCKKYLCNIHISHRYLYIKNFFHIFNLDNIIIFILDLFLHNSAKSD